MSGLDILHARGQGNQTHAVYLEVEADGLIQADQLRINLWPKRQLLHVHAWPGVKKCALLSQSNDGHSTVSALHTTSTSCLQTCGQIALHS